MQYMKVGTLNYKLYKREECTTDNFKLIIKYHVKSGPSISYKEELGRKSGLHQLITFFSIGTIVSRTICRNWTQVMVKAQVVNSENSAISLDVLIADFGVAN